MTSINLEVGVLIVAFIIAVTGLAFALDLTDMTDLLFRQQSAELMADRVAGNIHILQQYDSGHIEVDMESPYSIQAASSEDLMDEGLIDESRENYYYINLSWSDADERGYSGFHAENTFDFDIDVEDSRIICMRKTGTGNLVIEGGGC